MATGRNYGIAQSTRILLEGRPGSGKTTLARRLVAGLRERDIPVAGFTTEEIRERGRRVGFAIETAAGERGTLAHVEFPGPPRVGKYGSTSSRSSASRCHRCSPPRARSS